MGTICTWPLDDSEADEVSFWKLARAPELSWGHYPGRVTFQAGLT